VTFSIVAHDGALDWGVAVASKFPAAGSVVPWARAGVGAVATQALANVSFGPDGLDRMERGEAAADVLDALVASDEGRGQRQIGAVDASGASASFTGDDCMGWAGGTTGHGFACQGNILVGPGVVQEMSRAFAEAGGELADRLMTALSAGDAAGGDRRGRQSAALLVVRDGAGYGGRNDRYIDLRVDDHEDPVNELARVFRVFDEDYLVRDDPLVDATPEVVARLQRGLRHTGDLTDGATGELDGPTRAALARFAGRFNLEAKIRDDDQIFRSLVREVEEASGPDDG
jgi:uncharacterized Ntn-hydrolase superfamily protein